MKELDSSGASFMGFDAPTTTPTTTPIVLGVFPLVLGGQGQSPLSGPNNLSPSQTPDFSYFLPG